MYLSEFLPRTGDPYVLKRDGTFALLEQCTRIRGENALTYLENPKYADALRDRNISCLICTPEMEVLVPRHVQGLVFSPVPKSVFFHIHNLLVRSRKKWPSQISSSANISEDACIAPYNVIIGEDVEIQPKAIIHENTVIEDHVRICSGTIVGGQSFTVVRDAQGGMYLALDGGSIRIRTGAEICSGVHIACGTLMKDGDRDLYENRRSGTHWPWHGNRKPDLNPGGSYNLWQLRYRRSCLDRRQRDYL